MSSLSDGGGELDLAGLGVDHTGEGKIVSQR